MARSRLLCREHPVLATGEPVVERLVPQVGFGTRAFDLGVQGPDLLLSVLPFGDVAGVDHQAGHAPGLQEIGGG